MSEVCAELSRVAAFSDAGKGGNPAGVYISQELPQPAEMQSMAGEVGFSETSFACPNSGKVSQDWKVRYFSPESEVPFCGHATIATGVSLAKRFGAGEFNLHLSQTNVKVSGWSDELGNWFASLQSPPTKSKSTPKDKVQEALDLFGWTGEDLDSRIPPADINGGADHLVLALKSRKLLADMKYDFSKGQKLMRENGWVTILLVYAESECLFHTRNPFAYGGVYEDPATGAATAALSGYLRDIKWLSEGSIDIIQGEDMGSKSLIRADIPKELGSSIKLSGQARLMD